MSELMNDKLQVAIEERKIIQDIIHNQEAIRMKLVGWCITIISGFTIALYSQNVHLSSCKYLVFTLTVVLVFFLLDIVNRQVFFKMLKRSRAVEGMIQNSGSDYDGFKIEESMAQKRLQKMCIFDYRLISPYVALVIIILVSYFTKDAWK
jgi:hypothetical protein